MKILTWARSTRISRVEDLVFTTRRLSLFAYSFFAAQVIAFAIRFFDGRWMIDQTGHPTYLDFIQWWIGGHFALIRNAAGAYNYASFSAAQSSVTKSPPPVTYFHWVYPPSMLLLVEPFARLSYVLAFFSWVAATLCVFIAALYAIVPSLLAIVLALLPMPVVKNVFEGQTAFLMAGLLGLALALIGRRPYLAGACLGILTYKPQFVLFFPLALVVTRQWRVIAGAAASASLLVLLSALWFGSNAWLLFLRSSQGHNPVTLSPNNFEALNQTVFGLMHEVGAGTSAAWAVHLIVALVMTALACQIWLRTVPHSLKAAAFSIGVLTVTPYMLAYDLTAVSVPAAFLVQDALAHGFAPGERLILLGCFLTLFLCFNFAIGPIVLLALMILVVRRVRQETMTSRSQAANC